MGEIEIKIPNIGDFKDVEVIEVLVSEGQTLKKNDPLITIESDKSSVEIPSNFDGKIKTLKIKVGDKVSEGDLILILENINEDMLIAWVTELLSENIIPSKGCVLKTVIGVSTVAEWCTLWSDHKIGHLCIKRWMIYLLKSSIKNWKVVKDIITIIGNVLLNIPTLNQSIVWK